VAVLMYLKCFTIYIHVYELIALLLRIRSSQQDNETSGCVERGEFIEEQNGYQLQQKLSASWIYCTPHPLVS
jgi:hypothetical protein